MMYRKAVLGVALLGLPTLLQAQTPQPLVKKGDPILGMGTVDSFAPVTVNDSKTWTALVDTTLTDTNRDGALLRSGFVNLRQGSSLPDGVGLIDFNSVDMNEKGDLALALQVRFPGEPTKDALYWNSKLVAREQGPVNSPAVGFGTFWDTFNFVDLNDANTMLVIGKLQNPLVQGQKEDFMAKFELDPQGNVLSMTILATKTQVLPGLGGAAVGSVGTARSNFSMNNHGDFINFLITNQTTPVALNLNTILAELGGLSSVGRTWFSLSSSRVAINDKGDTILTGVLTGDTASDFLIEKNGAKWVQEGDILPALSDKPIDPGSLAPMILASNGDVFWRTGVLNGNDAFMRNFSPIMVANQTTVDGALVTSLASSDGAIAASQNGRFFLGEVALQGVGDALLLVDFGLVLELPGCFGNPGKLSFSSGASRVGQHIEFAMDNGHVAGALARINFSTRLRNPLSGCGVVGPFGEQMLSPANKVGSLFMPPWDGVNPTTAGLDIPPVLSLVDAVLFAQGNFRRPGTAHDFSLTNGLRIEIGAP